MTIGLASQTVLPISSSGRCPGAPSAWKKRPAASTGQIRRDAVLLPDRVVFLAVPRSGVDRAGALFQRHVVGQDAERIALQERMAEDRAFQLRARGTSAIVVVLAPAALLRRDLQQIRGDDVDVARHIHRRVLELRDERRSPCWPEWSRAWWSRSGRRRCGPPARDRSSPGRDVSAKRTQIDGLVWFSYSTSASASAVRSLMHQLTGFSPL